MRFGRFYIRRDDLAKSILLAVGLALIAGLRYEPDSSEEFREVSIPVEALGSVM